MIAGAALLITGFAITVISNRILHSEGDTPRYVGAAFGVVGLIIYLVGKSKAGNNKA